MTNLWAAVYFVFVLATFASRSAAQDVNLFACLGGPLPCYEEVLTHRMSGCSKLFWSYAGRVAWWPLRNVGPITVEVEAVNTATTRYPLYVEIVPVATLPCPSLSPGVVVMSTLGTTACPAWQTSAPIDISAIVPMGELYTVQLVFFRSITGQFFSPASDCIRVTAHPVSPVAGKAWGHVKTLYQ